MIRRDRLAQIKHHEWRDGKVERELYGRNRCGSVEQLSCAEFGDGLDARVGRVGCSEEDGAEVTSEGAGEGGEDAAEEEGH